MWGRGKTIHTASRRENRSKIRKRCHRIVPCICFILLLSNKSKREDRIDTICVCIIYAVDIRGVEKTLWTKMLCNVKHADFCSVSFFFISCSVHFYCPLRIDGWMDRTERWIKGDWMNVRISLTAHCLLYEVSQFEIEHGNLFVAQTVTMRGGAMTNCLLELKWRKKTCNFFILFGIDPAALRAVRHILY